IPGGASGAVKKTLALADRDGKIQPLGLSPQDYYHPRISPDGKQLAVGTDDGSEAVIWIQDIKSGGPPRRLTFGGRNRYPVWTPDGRRITFMSDREGDRSIFWQPADGSGTAERLSKAEAAVDHRPEAWSPDGKILSFRTTAQLGDIWMLPRTGDQK